MAGGTLQAQQEISDKVKTIRAYYKLCQKPEHRSIILKDQTFFVTLPTLLTDDNVDVVKYTVKILVLLTEQSADTELLAKSDSLLAALSEACEKIVNPSVNYNLMLVSSRIRALKNSIDAKSESPAVEPLANAVRELDKGGTIHRKFVSRKSKQLTMELDSEEFDEAKKRVVERNLLKKKGVISVYFMEQDGSPRVILRTVVTVDAKEIACEIFKSGLEYVAQIVKVEEKEEKFEMYASNVQKDQAVEFPDYLDEDMVNIDPTSCVITNDMANHGSGSKGGWFNSITSFVKTSFW